MAARTEAVRIEVVEGDLRASCEVVPAGRRRFAVTPVSTSDENVAHVGLLSAVYQKALERIGAADVVYRAGENAPYVRRVLSANGFAKSGDLYRASATALRKRLGLHERNTRLLLTDRVHHTVFDRNAALQAALWTLSRAGAGGGNGAIDLDAFDELDDDDLAALTRLFARAGAPQLVDRHLAPAMRAEGRLFAGRAHGELVAAMQLYATAPRQYTITPPVAADEEAANIGLLAAMLKCALDDVVHRDAGAMLVLHAAAGSHFVQDALRRAGFAGGRRRGIPRFIELTASAAALRRHLGLDRVTVSDVQRLRIDGQSIDRCGELLSMLSLAAVPLLRGCRRRPILLPPPASYGKKPAAQIPETFTAVREGVVFVEGLLQPAEQRKLFNYVQRSRKRFYTSTILANDGSLEVHRDYRSSRVVMNVDGIRPLMEAKIIRLLPAVTRELSIRRASKKRIEMQITASNDGDLFRGHTDNNGLPWRRLSYVYFFFEEPQRFRGGNLCFYDWQGRRLLTIRPKNNTIIFFHPDRRHEVLRVHVPSRRFAHSRFTVNGWVQR